MSDHDITRSAGTRAEIAAEQDRAAGGRNARRVSLLSGGTATASVSLARREDGGFTASLRFKHGGRTFRHSIGQVNADTRDTALRLAWDIAKERNLLVNQ